MPNITLGCNTVSLNHEGALIDTIIEMVILIWSWPTYEPITKLFEISVI